MLKNCFVSRKSKTQRPYFKNALYVKFLWPKLLLSSMLNLLSLTLTCSVLLRVSCFFSRRLSITSKWPAQSVQISSKNFLRNMFSKVSSLILTNVLRELLARFLVFLYFGQTNKASFNCEMLTEQKETLTAVSLLSAISLLSLS